MNFKLLNNKLPISQHYIFYRGKAITAADDGIDFNFIIDWILMPILEEIIEADENRVKNAYT